MRFTLRTLIIVIALVAIPLAAWVAYRRAVLCEVKWLRAGSTEAASLFPQPLVEEDRENAGEYGFTYYVQRRHVQDLVRMPVMSGASFRVDRQAIRVSAAAREFAQFELDGLKSVDQLKPNTLVLRGKVIDENDRPVAKATIDLMGAFVFINHFQTRDDGTFTMPLTDGTMVAPPGGGYYLRVRAPGDSVDTPLRWHSPTFSLSADQPERDVLIRIPHDSAAQQ